MSRCHTRQNLLMVIAAIAIGAGCSHDNSAVALKPSPVSTEAFYRPIPGADDPHDSPVDRGGAITAPVEAPAPSRPVVPAALPKPSSAPPAVAESKASPAASAGTTAEYLTVGAVVVEVSGTPIYADKVLQPLTPMFSTKAKELDADGFRTLARKEIITKVRDMITSELYYAAAMKNLTAEEKDRAWQLTSEWRKRQITEAGGSVPKAQAKALAEGMTLDEKAEEQHRSYIIQLWYVKKIYPRVEVTPEDMLKYYEAHRDKEFSETAKAQFRVIKITAASVGGVDQARAKITDLHQQATHQSDDDFAKMAGSINDPVFMRTQGRVSSDGWVEKGAFAITSLEDAIWEIQPGEVTDVIQVGDAFYIARLENRREKRTRTFDDPDVQPQIYSVLSQPQIAYQRDRLEHKLVESAVFNPPIDQSTTDDLEKISQPVLEMAMQKYPEWAGK